MIFYISDLHFFHDNIMRLSKRPFKNVYKMHQTIIDNWKKVVDEKDTVYILGDVGFYHQKEITDILHSLPGKKILITGNHDPKNLKNKDFRDCFAEITPYKEIKDNGRMVVLFHYPIEEWDGYFRNYYHIHGHVHNHDQDLKKIPKRFNVSVEQVNYTPITLDQLINRSC